MVYAIPGGNIIIVDTTKNELATYPKRHLHVETRPCRIILGQ